ncbi:MAG: nicotinate (nicotinamide) nucleotide adenylyltransferase [Phycisphaerales bacterium]
MASARLDDSLVGPCPVPAGVRLVLVFGGTFDPVTRAHTRIAEAAAKGIGADWTLFVPAKRNPLKREGPAASDADRVQMLRLALGGAERVGVSTLEVEREGASYTIDTVRELQRRVGEGVTLRLLIGADQALGFHQWREHEALLREAEPVVALRPPIRTREELVARLSEQWGGEGAHRWGERVVDGPLLDVAATEVREALEREGGEGSTAHGALHEAVRGHIRAHDLYAKRA